MRLTTLQPAYFPNLEFFWNTAQSDVLVLTDHFQYTKRSTLTISAPIQHSQPALRIPVRHGNPTLGIWEKRIDPGSNWAKKHLQTIRHIFNHAPYGYYYFPILKQILEEHSENLSRFISDMLIQIFEWLHMDFKVVFSSQLKHEGTNHDLIVEWCSDLGCDTYIQETKIFKQKLVDKDILNQSKIQTKIFAAFPEYHILQSNQKLSILHFLMQYGPEAGYLLRQYLPSD